MKTVVIASRGSWPVLVNPETDESFVLQDASAHTRQGLRFCDCWVNCERLFPCCQEQLFTFFVLDCLEVFYCREGLLMRYVLIVLFAVSLTGCAGAEKRRTAQAKFMSTIPTCHSDKECEYKWSAARRWILNNAGMRLQHVEPDYLETYNSGRNSAALAVRVVKEPIADGYRILVTTGCRNLFGCVPNSQDAAQDFNNTINAVSVPGS